MTHKTLGGAICPNQDVARRCPRCGWINPAVWHDAETPSPALLASKGPLTVDAESGAGLGNTALLSKRTTEGR